MQKKPSCATIESTLFTVSNDGWNTKEDTSKFMKNRLYILRLQKGTSLAQAMSNIKIIKPVALAVVE